MTPAQFNGLLAALGASPGVIVPFAGQTTPSGFLPCDGRAVSRTDFSALFTALGTQFGPGDGTTTFNIPDCRSRIPIGAGQGAGLSNYAVGATGGAESEVIAQANLPNIALDTTVSSVNPAVGGNSSVQGSSDAAPAGSVVGSVPLGGAGTALPILPPYIAFTWIIKT